MTHHVLITTKTTCTPPICPDCNQEPESITSSYQSEQPLDHKATNNRTRLWLDNAYQRHYATCPNGHEWRITSYEHTDTRPA